MLDEDGKADGFSIALMRAALHAMNRDVAFRTGPWTEVRGWLERGEVEALPLVGRTPEREQLFDFTVPYMTLRGALVVRNDEDSIGDMEDLRGRRVAVMKGDNAEEFLRREDRGIEIVTTSTFEVALAKLSQGDCDAVVMQRLVALRLLHKTGLTNLTVVNKPVEGFKQDFCFAVLEGDRETLALLNEGLAIVIADGTYRHLHSKWFAALQLPSDRAIIVGGDRNFPPFEFLDENGNPSGYNVDLTRAIAREMGMKMVVRLGNWEERVAALKEGKIDVLQGMFYSPERDLEFEFSVAHSAGHYIPVVRSADGPAPKSLEELSGKSVILQSSDILHEYVRQHGHNVEIFTVDSHEEALRRLRAGECDIAIVSRSTAQCLIEKHNWSGLVFGRNSILAPKYCYAVADGRKSPLLAPG
ncbi:MAG: transporter substrate-binding domain-containing protein [Planctomycetota bacterium]|nr:transporter substrate-binding domain-containing protein [Planctomycetota bacterium]